MTALVDGCALAPAWLPVLSRRQETHDTWTLELESGPGYAPGQFAMLYAFGAGEAPISVSRDRAAQPCTRSAPSAPSPARSARPRRSACAGPFGNTWPLAAAAGRDVVVVAGGIGLAPLRPVIDALLAERERYGRVRLLYGGAQAGRAALHGRARRAGARELDVAVTVDVPGPGWNGPVGVVTRLIARAALDPERTVAMMCGPEVMMRFAAAALLERGVRGGRDLGLDGAQHEMRRRSLRALPARAAADLPRRRRVPPRRGRPADGGGAAVTPLARRLEVRLLRRLPALAARLRGRAAGARGSARHRLLPRGRRAPRCAATTTSRSSRARSPPSTTPSASARSARARGC